MVENNLYWEKMARYGYESYADNSEWKNFQGNEMPLWDNLPQNIRDNWIHTVKCLINNGSQEMLRLKMRGEL